MKKRILSLFSIIALCVVMAGSVVNAETSDSEPQIVDGSYLTTEDSSTGYSHPPMAKGEYLMTGVSTISKAGLTRVYAYASTTANQTVDYMATLVYVERYNEETGNWGFVYAWAEEAENADYMSTADSVKVDRGYYYRVRSQHIAGDYDDYPYDETASVTNGILLP
ncbi:MAG TPA: hypothetical protein H9765_04055 [Candidatus Mediterraneibacter intestinigallinarum]|nr:hypothetical protein [Candidatus Mediterraneibacter intestinigallinarum]